MKIKKKILISMLCSIFILGDMQALSVKAAASPVLSASADKAGIQNGEYVTISISLKNNPGIVTMGATLTYDSSVLKYCSCSWSGSFSDNDIIAASDTGNSVNLSVVCSDSYTIDGVIADIRFEAVESASSLPVTLQLQEMTDTVMDPINNCQVSSSISVPSGNNTGSEGQGDSDSSNEPVYDDTYIDEPEHDAPSYDGMDDEKYDNPKEDGILTDDERQDTVQTGDTGQESTGGTGNVTQNTRTDISSKSIQVGNTSNTGNTETDENYKTGANFGNDKYILLSAVCGILAMVLLCRKEREDSKKG